MVFFDDTALEHAGVKGMKWGKRKAVLPGSQGERNAYYQKNPTARQYLTGKGENYAARVKSRKNVGLAAVTSFLAGSALKVAANTLPGSMSVKLGAAQVGHLLQVGGAIAGATALVSAGGDLATGGRNK